RIRASRGHHPAKSRGSWELFARRSARALFLDRIAERGPIIVGDILQEAPRGLRSRTRRQPMTSPTDGQLLRAFRQGDSKAFGELVELHQGTLLRHARALLGPGSPYEDVVQDVFLKLAERPPVIPPEVEGDRELERVHLSNWLHKVTRNGCMDI